MRGALGGRAPAVPQCRLDKLARRAEKLLPATILAVAVFLRFFRLAEVPRGLLYDEAWNGVDVLRILAGARPAFLADNFGREPLYWDRNIPRRPIFDPASAVLAAIGLGLALRRFRQPAYAFLLLWLAVMLGPSILAVRDVPDYLRVTGLIPALFALPALALAWIWRLWETRTPAALRSMPVFLIGLAFLAGSLFTYRDYTGVWARSPHVAQVFSSDGWMAAELAIQLCETTSPLYLAAGDVDAPLVQYALQARTGRCEVRLFDGARSIIFPPEPGRRVPVLDDGSQIVGDRVLIPGPAVR